MNNKQKTVQVEPGLALLITVQRKKYEFVHGDVSSKKSYTLGGLYADLGAASGTEATKNTISRVRENVWGSNPSPEYAENLGKTLFLFPRLVETVTGSQCLDESLQTFHKMAKSMKNALLKHASGGVIPSNYMSNAEEKMKPYNLDGYTVKVTAIRVEEFNFKGARKRSDGKFEGRKTLRTTYINRMLSEAEIDELLSLLVRSLTDPIPTNVSTKSGFTYTTDGDRVVFQPVSVTTVTAEGVGVINNIPANAPPGVKAWGRINPNASVVDK